MINSVMSFVLKSVCSFGPRTRLDDAVQVRLFVSSRDSRDFGMGAYVTTLNLNHDHHDHHEDQPIPALETLSNKYS